MALFQKLKGLSLKLWPKLGRLTNPMPENTEDHFLCFYPGNSGYLIQKLIKRLINKLNFDDHNIEKIKNIDTNNIVVYASKNKRVLDFLYFHTKLKNLNLPYPQIGFDFRFLFLLPVKQLCRIFICHMNYFFRHFHFEDAYTTGYATKQLLNGRSGFICLIEEEDFYKRFIKSTPDPLFLLIELQKNTKKSVIIIPEDIIYITKPMRKNPTLADILLGTHEKPGLIKRFFIILKKPEKIRVEITKPVNLKQFISRPEIEQLASEFQVHRLRSHLVDILNRQRKSITGPVLKSRQEITEDILTKKSLREYLAEYASENKLTLSKTHKKAAGYIKEIAANYNLQIINFGNWLLAWVFKNIFEDLVVNQEQINRMREKSTKAPLILVPCHKSHLDYLLLPYVMFKNNMPCPHIAAGKNLSFWPLGPLFRGGGAFFLRRTFKGAPLYAKIFAAYLEKLLYEGFNIKIFIEGGRSRTGKLLSPKPGGLAMLINAYINGACSNLYFVPVFIGYDRVLEEDAYLKEIEGGKKTPETLKGLINARKFLKKKYGKVYMRFDEPISIKEYIQKKNIDLSKTSSDEYIKFIKSFGYKLINAINTNAVVTPHGIIASAVLNCSKNSFTKKQMIARVNTYMNLLTFMNAELSDTLLIDSDNTLNSVVNDFISRNFIELADEDDNDITEHTVFIVKDNKRAILDYYKNSVISFFVKFAYTAVAILETDRFQFSSSDLVVRYKFLEKIFTDEFFFDEETTYEEDISTCIKGFINDGIIVPDSRQLDMFSITSQGLRKLKWFAAFLQPFFESYKTTLLYFEKYEAGKHEGKEQIKKIHSKGTKLYKGKIITFKESLSLVNYKNAVHYFTKSGINGSQDHTQIEYYKNIIDRLILLIAS
ncbi:1-acyl-sn-glycerol-3-phosphate acyltransferase [Desulfobacula toluolica]|uniref:Glycerol-3-phosphate acyltransferase n=1 Tax=Desulfobacula toluolica (strain DSM 7467 / Tol2) TaxID=651182 RepID=K0NAU7_DESTT|nr:1-acyl-sn-glycerol-3-phosphate acyltransferase [Desulfobacula toluolica]CCK81304.1 PlsB: glycerol-3-phosphate acyltransferase [Desulfobacula toluolica Tol2]